ncbi:MAG TPA: acetylxylan esterase [Candidatus Latescibacteria bacterium]|nr:acetylxylan esterase [Candidatus Latescibacterota bacterium]
MPDAAPSPVRVSCDRADAMYRVGEAVSFLVEKVGGGSPDDAVVTVTWNGGAVVHTEQVKIGALPQMITVGAEQPGFLRCRMQWEGLDASSEAPQAAAAVSPERILPSMPEPEDFDAFWTRQLAAQRDLALDATVLPHSEHPDGVIYNARVPMPDGTSVFGWLLVPHGSGPFPAIARYHGAGVYAVPPENGLDWTTRGIMVFSINPHAIPNDRDREFYLELRNGGLSDYRIRGRENPERVYFRTMFQRAARAVDFLASRPEWDGAHLIAEGHSQGGGQAVAAAALNRKVNGLVVSCCTHCDHTGPAVGRVAGWPKIVNVENGIPDPAHLATARYIDAVNFAARISCPTFWSMAFLDDLCPSVGNYAAYNRLCSARKMVRHDVAVGHIHTDECKAATVKWVEEFVRS